MAVQRDCRDKGSAQVTARANPYPPPRQPQAGGSLNTCAPISLHTYIIRGFTVDMRTGKNILPPSPPSMPAGSNTVGITTTVPVEVLLGAGCVPVDLNNLFITSPFAEDFILTAERSGFPRTCCSWTKGMYGAVRRYGIGRVVVVLQGDCNNNQALAEMLEYEGVECIPFAFPHRQNVTEMAGEMRRFAGRLGTDPETAEVWRERLGPARKLAHEIDMLSWREGKVHGLENHLWLVSTGDFCTNPDRYRSAAERFLESARGRNPIGGRVRLGVAGVPPIVPEIYEFLESRGATVIYNETQHQFSMPRGGETLQHQYTGYTYPYGIRCRLKAIGREARRRRLDGIVHYVQSFCYRRIEDRILRDALPMPVITLEQDRPGAMTGQIKTRLEAFVELLWSRKSGHEIF